MSGYHVRVAYNGEEALQLARRVRLDPGGKLYISSRSPAGDGRKTNSPRTAGFDHHLTKPVDPDEVENVLQAFFRRQLGHDMSTS